MSAFHPLTGATYLQGSLWVLSCPSCLSHDACWASDSTLHSSDCFRDATGLPVSTWHKTSLADLNFNGACLEHSLHNAHGLILIVWDVQQEVCRHVLESATASTRATAEVRASA